MLSRFGWDRLETLVIWTNISGRVLSEDFGIEFEERIAPEIDAQEQLTPVGELIDGFSFSDQWMENALAICKQKGLSEANCVVILFNVRYPAGLAEKCSPSCPIKFVGNIEWDASATSRLN